MEIERKFLISKENLPADLDSYPHLGHRAAGMGAQ